MIGLASIIGIVDWLAPRNAVSPTARTAILGVVLIGGSQLFYPFGWRALAASAIVVVATTWLFSLSSMNTPAASVASWIAIIVVALAVWAYDRSRRNSGGDARA